MPSTTCQPTAALALQTAVCWSYVTPPSSPPSPTDTPLPRDCREVHDRGQRRSGVYLIDPECPSVGTFNIYCDMDTTGGPWMVIQRRMDGSVNFRRKWADYAAGFGHLDVEHWLGLNKTHCLTTRRPTASLRVDMSDFDGNTKYALYQFFNVDKPCNLYRLSVGGYSGTAGDSLSYHNRMAFTTYDQDNDEATSNCANSQSAWSGGRGYPGGWWYKECINREGAGLNGAYAGVTWNRYISINYDVLYWYKFKGWRPLKFAEMKIKWN